MRRLTLPISPPAVDGWSGRLVVAHRRHCSPPLLPSHDTSPFTLKRAAIESFNAATEAYIIRWKKNLQHAPGGVRIMDIPGANRYIFLGNQDDVLRELRGVSGRLELINTRYIPG